MTSAKNFTNALFAFIVVGAVAGCAGPASVTGVNAPAGTSASLLGSPVGTFGPARAAARTGHGWLSPGAATQRLIFVSDNAANAIRIYPQGKTNPAPIGEITDGISAPLGNFVDKNGTLYVVNSGNSTVTEYPLGTTTPSVTLSTGLNFPISVAVDRAGTVAVGEFAQGAILEFPAGSVSPTVTITLLTKPEGLAFDRTRHLYAAWNGGTSSLVGTVSKCEELRAVCVNEGMSEGEAGGLALDPAGNIVLGDQTNHVINIYAPGSATPTRSISTGTVSPYKFELNRGGTILYVADNSGTPEIVEYNYATGAEIGTITNSLSSTWGVSLYPAEAYAP
jgi:hypothetical protein